MKTKKEKLINTREETYYTIFLKMGDKTLKGKGITPLEALQNISKPLKITEKGILQIHKNGELKKEILMLPIRLKRLFYSKFQEVQIKSLTMGIK